MRHLGLFEGIGGFSLSARWAGWETVAWCEWNPFGQKVLRHHFPNAEGHGDITQTDFSIYRGRVDIITGGFPCQDASNANQSSSRGSGTDGERTGLVAHMLRAINEVRPRYVVAENVANILKTNGGRDFGKILTELARMGYNAEWRVYRACEKGAPHKRARCFMVIYANSIRLQAGQTFLPYVSETIEPYSWNFARTAVQIFRGGSWKTEPPVLLLDDGIPNGLHSEGIKAYGNAIVPQIALSIFLAIQDFEDSLLLPLAH
jgi:DNA (cytosine-5)-methyltransferase 1